MDNKKDTNKEEYQKKLQNNTAKLWVGVLVAVVAIVVIWAVASHL